MVLYKIDMSPSVTYLIPLVMAIIFWFAPNICALEKRRKLNIKLAKVIYRTTSVILVGITIYLGYSNVNDAKYIQARYENGDYQEVEGYVTDYVKGNYSRDRAEGEPVTDVFTVGGISFAYPLNEVSVITGNGMHLKIQYIFDEGDEEPLILKIEELK